MRAAVVRRRLAAVIMATVAVVIAVGFAGCGSSEPSGTYEAAFPGGGGVRIVFSDDNKARVSLFSPGGDGEISHNTVYSRDGDKLHFTTNEPMGVPMDLVYKDGVLSDGGELVFKKK